MDDFKDKSSSEILAMVTFRFAQLYFGAMEMSDRVDKTLSGLEKSLDKMLFELTPDSGKPGKSALIHLSGGLVRLDGGSPPSLEKTNSPRSTLFEAVITLWDAAGARSRVSDRAFYYIYHIPIPYS